MHKRAQFSRIGILTGFAMLWLAVLAGGASASPWGGAEQRMIDQVNDERRAHGLRPMAVDVELQRVARDWAEVMAREDRLYHNPNMGSQVQRAWQSLGENVGWAQRPETSESALVDGLHQSFMASAGHRANILRPDYTWIGVGTRVTASGKMWTTVNFMDDAGGAAPPHLGPGEFHDVSGGIHAPSIKTIALAGITQGCTAELFCPDRQVTRAQMASFLVRALKLPAVPHDHFSDDRGSSHEGAINSLAAAGIAQGCADGFCPNTPVTRAQMASFIQRAWDLPVTTTSVDPRLFSDLGSSVHSPSINAIADRGITLGCGDGGYCPSHPVRRAEMASFLARALDPS